MKLSIIKNKKEFLTIEEAKQRAYFVSMSYKPMTLFKKVLGYSLITYGVVTLPLPTGSQLALLSGCYVLGISYKTLYTTIKTCYQRVNSYICFKLYWFKIGIRTHRNIKFCNERRFI